MPLGGIDGTVGVGSRLPKSALRFSTRLTLMVSGERRSTMFGTFQRRKASEPDITVVRRRESFAKL